MLKRCLSILIGVATATACIPTAEVDSDETSDNLTLPASVEFDPAQSIIPFPNNLVLNPATRKVSLPAQCNETASATGLRSQGLNSLDGFGTFKMPLQVTFTEPVDVNTVVDVATGNCRNVYMFKMMSGATPASPLLENPIPLACLPGTSVRFDAECQIPAQVETLTIVPKVPLQENATYAVSVVSGVKTSQDVAFAPSSTWALVRQRVAPVTLTTNAGGQTEVVRNNTGLDPTIAEELESLIGLDLLWKAHAQPLSFLEMALGRVLNGDASLLWPRADMLLAWSFTAQTISRPFDAAVTGTPASQLTTAAAPDTMAGPLQVVASGSSAVSTLIYDVFTAALGAPPPVDPCTFIPCSALGSVEAGVFLAPNFQPVPPSGPKVTSSWSDPLIPALVRNEAISVLVFIPAAPAPTAGYPVVLFEHGITRKKEDLFAIGSQLAAYGFASVAIDTVLHGSRAAQILTANIPGVIDCTGTPDPSTNAGCFAQIFSTDLLATRDNFRQTVLDTQKLVRVLKNCGTTACGDLKVDNTRISFMGQSLGALIGGVTAAVTSDIRAAVLNVGGAGWVDVLVNTQRTDLQCLLVNGLVSAGILPVGTDCTTSTWKTHPAFLQFSSIARWILDSADAANFTRQYFAAQKPVLIQEVVGDAVVPNVAQEQHGALLGLTPTSAAVGTGATPPATTSVKTSGSHWLTYDDLQPNAALAFPGNVFSHGSLLLPQFSCLQPPVPGGTVCTTNADCGAGERCGPDTNDNLVCHSIVGSDTTVPCTTFASCSNGTACIMNASDTLTCHSYTDTATECTPDETGGSLDCASSQICGLGTSGILATAQMQTDAIAFLCANLNMNSANYPACQFLLQ